MLIPCQTQRGFLAFPANHLTTPRATFNILQPPSFSLFATAYSWPRWFQSAYQLGFAINSSLQGCPWPYTNKLGPRLTHLCLRSTA